MKNLTTNPRAIFAGTVLLLWGLTCLDWHQVRAFSIEASAPGAIAPVPRRGSPTGARPSKAQGEGKAISYSSRLMMASDGNYYGSAASIRDPKKTTATGSGWGVVFRQSSLDQQITVLHAFSGSDGALPTGALVESADGFLYGAASDGGDSGDGVIYRVGKDGNGFSVLHSLNAKEHGAHPLGGLVQDAAGNLYVTASQGGPRDRGTIFQITTGGALTVLHSFGDSRESDGVAPQGGLIIGPDGFLYGTTRKGGDRQHGTIFKIATNGNGFQTIHQFDERDGAAPDSEMIDGGDGFLYGVAALGGEKNGGVLFRIASDGTAFQVLHIFGQVISTSAAADSAADATTEPTDGSHPLYLATLADGFVYGTTLFGGSFSHGVLYRVSRNGTDYSILDNFTGDGYDPRTGPLVGARGQLILPPEQSSQTGSITPLQALANQYKKALSPENRISVQSATWTVTSTSDDPNDASSLRYAVNHATTGDTINFNLSGCPCTINLTSGSMVIANTNLTIAGPGADQLTISGGIFNIDHGDGKGATPTPVRVFFIDNAFLTLSGVTVANGVARGADGGCGGSGGGGGAGVGGAMFFTNASGTIHDVTFLNNQAIGGNGGNGNYCIDISTGANNSSIAGGGGGGGFGFVDGAGFRQVADGDGNGGYGAGGGLNGSGGTAAAGQLPADGGVGGSRGADGEIFVTPNGDPGGAAGVSGNGAPGGGGGGGGRGGINFLGSTYFNGGVGGDGTTFGGGGGGGGGCSGSNGGNGVLGGGGGGGGWAQDHDSCFGGLGGNGDSGGGNGGNVGGGGGGGAALGGAIFTIGNLDIANCTFNGNSVQGGAGGRVQTTPHPTGTNPTDGAAGTGAGGAIYAWSPANALTSQMRLCNLTLGPNQDIPTIGMTGITTIAAPTGVQIQIPSEVCAGVMATATVTFNEQNTGSFTYSWSLSSGTINSSSGSTATFTPGGNLGDNTLTVMIGHSFPAGCAFSFETQVLVVPQPLINISTAPAFCANSTGNKATLPAVTNPSWHITGGTITSGGNSQTVTFTAGPSGSVTLTANGTVSGAACASSVSTGQIPIVAHGEDATSFAFNSGSFNQRKGNALPQITFTANDLASITETGALPPGVSFSQEQLSNNGTFFNAAVLSGTPTQIGSFPFSIITNNGCSSTANYTLNVFCDSLVVTAPSPMPAGDQGVAYSATFGPSGATFSLQGTLPQGLTLASNGVLSGTPLETGSFSFTVNAVDPTTQCTGSVGATINVKCEFTALSPAFVPQANLGAVYTPVTFTRPGDSSVTFSLGGSLPNGMTLTAQGVLSGTPTEIGLFPFSVNSTDAVSCAASQSYLLAVGCGGLGTPYLIQPGAIAAGAVGSPYRVNFSTNGSTPVSHQTIMVESGRLAAGMAFIGGNANGSLVGTPTEAGIFPITLGDTDIFGACGPVGASVSFYLVINCPGVSIQTGPATLAAATNDQAYPSTTLFAANGGAAPYTYQLVGNLPPGMALTNGVLSGTPTAIGSYSFTVFAIDSHGCPGVSNYTLLVQNPASCGVIAFSPSALPQGATGAAYPSVAFAGISGTGQFSFTEAGSLPAGMSFANGILSGTPTASGFFPLSVAGVDANGCTAVQTYTLTVTCAGDTTTINPATLPAGVVGASYFEFFNAGPFNSVNTPSAFALTGNLPNGVSYTNQGQIFGTPTQSGAFPITMAFLNPNTGCAVTHDYLLVVGCSSTTITVGPAALPGGSTHSAYAATTLSASGGGGPYSFTVSGLPAGLTLSNGVISGTPTQSGTFNITVAATDASGCAGSANYSVTINNCPLITVGPGSIPGGVAGSTYQSTTFTQTGGAGTVTFSETGAMPAGMTLSPSGVLSGTPTQTGTFPITVQATDSNGCIGSAAYSLVIGCQVISVSAASVPSGTAGTTYAGATFNQTGGIGTVTFTETGSLPTGITLSSAGALSGTPTQTGTFPIIVKAADANGCSGTASFNLVVNCATITVGSGTIATGTAGAAYSGATFTQTGGLGTVTFSETGALPAGMTLSSGGVLSGTPTQSGTFSIAVKATDSNGCTGTGSYSLIINCPTITVGPGTIASGTAGSVYAGASFTQSGGVGSVTFTETGALPTGITLSTAGALSGTPTQSGTFPIVVKATDAAGCSGTASYSLVIGCPTITVGPGTIAAGTAGVAHPSVTFTQTGGVGSVTFAETGTLPTGMTFSAGVLSGTPTQTGTFPISVKATDSNGCFGSTSYSLVVNCATITVGPATIAAGTAGVPYSGSTFNQSGGVGAITFTETGTLPVGMTFSGGVLSGTPTQTGTFPISVKATDSNGCFGSTSYSLVINCPTISVGPATIPSGTAGVTYSGATFSQTGGVGSITLTETGTLPTGMTFSAGVLSGTPTQTGTFPISVKATDVNGCVGTASYSLVINCPTISVGPGTIASGTAGVTYSGATFSQTGGVGAITFTETGTLPTGITFSAGVLSGTPTQTGTFPISIKATDANGCFGTTSYSLVINCPTITVGPGSIAAGTAGVAYPGATFSQTGGVGAITFTETGTLPAGMSFSAGVLSGTPTQTGTFPITVKATDANGCFGTSSNSLVINCPTISVGPGTVAAGTAGVPYSNVVFTQTGGVGTVTYTESGTLPAGMHVSAGVLSGTPTQTGTFSFSMKATDANGCFGAASYSLVINCPTISVGPGAVPAGVAGVPYSGVIFTQTGGVGSVSFTESGVLPTGMALTAGVLSGTPTQTGSFPITVKATDANGCFGSASYTLVIACPAISVGPGSIPNGVAGVSYTTAHFIETGGVGTITYNESGTLPSGMTFTATGVLSGTPLQIGSFPITVTAADRNGCTGSASFTLVIACPTIVVSGAPSTAVQFVPSQPVQFTETGGVGTMQYSTAGPLPAGMTFSAAGLLSGTPQIAGTFPITVTATDVNGCTGSMSLTLNVIALDKCLQDTTTGDTFQFSSITGDYLLTRCATNYTMSGRGTLSNVNGLINLSDSKADRRVNASYNPAQKTGTASITIINGGTSQVVKINSTNPNHTCVCGR